MTAGNKKMQRLIIGVVLAAALLFGGLLLLPRLVPEQDVRAAVARSLRAATGVEPRIEGDVRLSLFPRPALRFDRVQLDDGARPGLSAGSLLATVRLTSLLFGAVEIAAFTFERPKLALELDRTGVRIVGLPFHSPEPGPGDAGLLPEFRIVDGTIELRPLGLPASTLAGVDASLVWSTTGFTASGTFEWRQIPIAATLVLADLSTLRRGERTPLRLRLEADRAKLAFEGGLAFRSGPHAEGTLVFETRSVRDLLAHVGTAPAPADGLNSFSLKTQLSLTIGSLSLAGMAIELDGNRGEGGMSLKLVDNRTIIQGTLATEELNLRRYLAAGTDQDRDWSRRAIDLSALDDIDFDLRLSARRVFLGKAEFERLAVSAVHKEGRLTVSLGEAQIFGGVLRGTAATIPSQQGIEIKLDATALDFDFERALATFGGMRRIEGRASLAVALESSGTTLGIVAQNLAGQASLGVKQGAIQGVNADEVLRRLERKPLSGFGDLRGGRTPFDNFSAKIRIAEGTATLDEMQVESPLVRVTLAGAASIARRDVDLRGVASLVRPSSGGAKGFELPFLLQGPWDNPLLLPDADALIRRSGAAAPLLDATRKGTLRSVIDSLTAPRNRTDPDSTGTPATPR